MSPDPAIRRTLCGILACALSGLASCSREDAGLKERVAVLEAELGERKGELDKMRKAVTAAEEAAREAAATPAAPPAPDLDAAKKNYLSGIEDYRGSLAAALPGVRISNVSVYPVERIDPETPIRSRVVYQVTIADGRTADIAVPLVANAAGDWTFPPAEEIAGAFKKAAPRQAPPAAPPVAAQSPPAQTPAARTTPPDVMGANKTVQVEWADKTKPAPTPPRETKPQPAPAQPAPAPAQPPAGEPKNPGQIKKVMPSSRDVIIDFED